MPHHPPQSNKSPQQSNNLWKNLPNILKGCAAIIRAIKWNGGITSITGILVIGIPSTILITKTVSSLSPIPPLPKIDYEIESKFDMADAFSEGLARVRINGRTGYINPTGNIVIPPTFDGAQSFSEGLALAWTYGKNRGYIKKDGTFSIQPQYARNAANQFSEGLARVCPTSICGYIDKNGEIAVERNFSGAGDFSENLAPVKIDDKWGYINTNGKIEIEQKFDEAHKFTQKLAPVKINAKWGYIDTNGTIVIQPQFDNIGSFSEDLAPIKINGKWGYIHTNGTIVIEPQFDDAKIDPYSKFRCDVAEPRKNLHSGNSEPINCHNLENRYNFSEGLASVMIKDKWGYINKKGEIVIHPQFTRVSKFSERLAAVCNDNKCGYISNPLTQ
ncbi:WG repeat-containing protein [Scytonema sp. NUACC21]